MHRAQNGYPHFQFVEEIDAGDDWAILQLFFKSLRQSGGKKKWKQADSSYF